MFSRTIQCLICVLPLFGAALAYASEEEAPKGAQPYEYAQQVPTSRYFSVNTGMALVIPVSRFGTARATEGSEILTDGRQQVEAAILHDKAKVGVELNLTALIGF